MKKTAKIASLFLSAAMCVSMAGCGRETAETGGRSAVITVWSGNGNSMSVMKNLVDQYNATTGKEKGIKIAYEVKVDNLGQALDLALASNQAPEIFGGGGLTAKADNGDIMAIDDMPGGKELIEKFKPYMTRGFQYRGKYYCLPIKAQTYGLIYNTDMFEQEGIVDENGKAKPPVTFDEFRAAAKKLTDPSKSRWGIGFAGKWGGLLGYALMSPMMGSAGTRGYDPSTGRFDYTGFAPMVDIYLGMKKDGSVFPGMDGLDNDTLRAHFAEGGIGMMLGVSWDVGVLNDQFPAKVNWSVAPLPVMDENNCYKQGYETGTFGMINKRRIENGADPEKVMEVYQFLHSDEVVTELYKNCCDIPYSFDLVKDVKIDAPKTGWKEFSALLDISQLIPIDRPADLTGEDRLEKIFTNEIWVGKVSPEEGLKRYSDIANAGAEKYARLHSDFDLSVYMVEGWTPEKR